MHPRVPELLRYSNTSVLRYRHNSLDCVRPGQNEANITVAFSKKEFSVDEPLAAEGICAYKVQRTIHFLTGITDTVLSALALS